MKFAYADPPYLGCCRLYAHHHPDGLCWDELDTHKALIERLVSSYPDGWALSLHLPSLAQILQLCPVGVRVGAWVKPFASFKPGVSPAYAWEPVIWIGGRRRGKEVPTVRDWVSANITMKKGLPGAKPHSFNLWILDVLGFEVGDSVDDLFPGTGGMAHAIEQRTSEQSTQQLSMLEIAL